MSSHRLKAYQIEILDFKKRKDNHHNDMVVLDTKGIYICPSCGWEGNWLRECPKCDNANLHPKNRIKIVDTLSIASRRTLVGLFYKDETAKRWGERYGTVISCRKVDKTKYLENTEHLKLKQEPITIEIEQDFILNRALELERPRRQYDGGGINIEVK